MSKLLTKQEIARAYEKAKEWVAKNFPSLAPFVEEAILEFVETKDGWDIRACVSERKIKVNLFRVRWYLEREKKIKVCSKYDIETALIHDVFEYCYFRLWNYPENDPVIVGLTHHRARQLENMLRNRKGLKKWI